MWLGWHRHELGSALNCIALNRSREDAMRQYVRLTECSGGSCPAFDEWTDTGEFRVTGYKVAPEDKLGIPDTEDVVTVPRETAYQFMAALLARPQRAS